MGYANSAFVAQTASELTYGQATMIKFLKHKGWNQGSIEWPFHDISEILIIYLDDLCLTMEKNYENAHQVHLNALEFILFATKLYRFKIGKGKFNPWVTCFKFLGHQFDVSKSTNSIPPDRLKALKDFRSPASCAETLSRLGVLSYYRKYVPLLSVLAAPLNKMALTGCFKWDKVHQLAWKTILFIASMGFELHVIDKHKPIYYCTDSSQISVAYFAFQVIDGEIRVVNMDSKILKSSDRNKPAAFREMMLLLFAIIQNEAVIRAHIANVLVLTDCIGLSYVFRLKDSSSKLLEVSLFLGTFSNLFVRYSTGSSLFMADLLMRQFNKKITDYSCYEFRVTR